jgi:hypothetical protein
MTTFLTALDNKGREILSKTHINIEQHKINFIHIEEPYTININLNENTKIKEKKSIYYKDGYNLARETGIIIEELFLDYVHNNKNEELMRAIFSNLCNKYKLSLFAISRAYDTSEIRLTCTINNDSKHAIAYCERYFLNYINDAKIAIKEYGFDNLYSKPLYDAFNATFKSEVEKAICKYCKDVENGLYDNSRQKKEQFDIYMPRISYFVNELKRGKNYNDVIDICRYFILISTMNRIIINQITYDGICKDNLKDISKDSIDKFIIHTFKVLCKENDLEYICFKCDFMINEIYDEYMYDESRFMISFGIK